MDRTAAAPTELSVRKWGTDLRAGRNSGGVGPWHPVQTPLPWSVAEFQRNRLTQRKIRPSNTSQKQEKYYRTETDYNVYIQQLDSYSLTDHSV